MSQLKDLLDKATTGVQEQYEATKKKYKEYTDKIPWVFTKVMFAMLFVGGVMVLFASGMPIWFPESIMIFPTKLSSTVSVAVYVLWVIVFMMVDLNIRAIVGGRRIIIGTIAVVGLGLSSVVAILWFLYVAAHQIYDVVMLGPLVVDPNWFPVVCGGGNATSTTPLYNATSSWGMHIPFIICNICTTFVIAGTIIALYFWFSKVKEWRDGNDGVLARKENEYWTLANMARNFATSGNLEKLQKMTGGSMDVSDEE